MFLHVREPIVPAVIMWVVRRVVIIAKIKVSIRFIMFNIFLRKGFKNTFEFNNIIYSGIFNLKVQIVFKIQIILPSKIM